MKLSQLKSRLDFSPGGIVRATFTVSSLTIVSRLLGLVRDLLFARVLGAGLIADAFLIAFRIPNLFRSLLAEGAMTSAFVPALSEKLSSGDLATAKCTVSVTATFLFLLSTAITIFGVIFSEQLIGLMAPGFLPDGKSLAKDLLAIMFPYLVSITGVALCSAILNVQGVFGSAPMAQIVVNICNIVGILVASQFIDSAIYIVAYSILVGALAQLLVQFYFLRRVKIGLSFRLRFWTKELKQITVLMLPALFGAAVYQCSVFINSLLASLLAPGSISWLFYADRLAQLPLGIFTVALGTALLPKLSKLDASGSREDFARNLDRSLAVTSAMLFGFVACAWPSALMIIQFCFERGAFTENDSRQTAAAFKVICLSAWALSCSSIATKALLARKDTLTPALISLVSLLVGTLVSIALMGTTSNEGFISAYISWIQINLYSISFLDLPELAHVGLAWGMFFTAVLSLLLSITALCLGKTKMRFREFYIYSAISCFALSFSFTITNFFPYQLGINLLLGSVSYVLSWSGVFWVLKKLMATRL